MSNLLLGLPDHLVLEEIVPRLPWYTRPVCRATSKLWRTTIDSEVKDPKCQFATQRYQLPRLTHSTLIFSIDNGNSQSTSLLLVEDVQHVRQLPPVPLFSGTPRLVFWNGMVYVWTLADREWWHGERDRIFKLDLGRGHWQWQSFPVGYISAWFDEVCYKGSIYAAWEYRPKFFGVGQVRLNVHVYDMSTDTCRKIEKWPYASVGVSWNGLTRGSGKLAGFKPENENPWDLVIYDGGKWEMREVIPGAAQGYPRGVKFVRGDCFIPTMTEGFNLVIVHENDETHKPYLEWYNSKCSEGSWATVEDVESGLGDDVGPLRLKVVNGQLYGLCEKSGGERCCLFKGRIDLTLMHRKVVWKLFLELGSSIKCWTEMNE